MLWYSSRWPLDPSNLVNVFFKDGELEEVSKSFLVPDRGGIHRKFFFTLLVLGSSFG